MFQFAEETVELRSTDSRERLSPQEHFPDRGTALLRAVICKSLALQIWEKMHRVTVAAASGILPFFQL
jgi:hypothetical protein